MHQWTIEKFNNKRKYDREKDLNLKLIIFFILYDKRNYCVQQHNSSRSSRPDGEL